MICIKNSDVRNDMGTYMRNNVSTVATSQGSQGSQGKVRGKSRNLRFSQGIPVARSCVTAFHFSAVSFSNSSSFLLG